MNTPSMANMSTDAPNAHQGVGATSSSLQPIPADEAKQLAKCEATIRKGLSNFVAVGNALLAIQQSRLYRATHPTFAQYCKERWGMARSQAYRVIESARIVGILPIKAGERAPLQVESVTDALSPLGDMAEVPKTLPTPYNERSIRPLSKLSESKIPKAYERAVEIARGEPPTAAQVEQAVREFAPKADAEARDDEKSKSPSARPSKGIQYAAMAISQLEKIDPLDTQRTEAFDQVIAWIIKRNRRNDCHLAAEALKDKSK